VKKRSTALLMVLALALSGFVYALHTDETHLYAHEVILLDDLFADLQFQAELAEHLEYLNERFGAEFLYNHNIALWLAHELYALFPTANEGAVIYPHYFAGLKIGDDGNLIMRVVRGIDDREVMDFVLAHNIQLELVRFSQAELIEVWEYIFQFSRHGFDTDSDCPVYLNLVKASVGADNRVTVYLADISEYQIALFREVVIDHPALTFDVYCLSFFVEFTHIIDYSGDYDAMDAHYDSDGNP